MKNWTQFNFILFVFSLQAISIITLILDIPIARQVSGFVFLIFVPGFVILRLFNLERFDITENVLFSVGLSLAFLMLTGFLMNELGPLILLSEPLNVEYLSIIINVAVSLMCMVSYFKNKETVVLLRSEVFNKLPQLIFYLIIPLLSVLGVLLVNAYDSNLLLLSLIIVIPIIVLSSLFSSKLSSNYPLIIFSVALALLFSITLISRYSYGPDITLEYNVFRETQSISSLNWEPTFWTQLTYKSMLSVTILPTIFSNLLNLEGDWVFKIIFPVVFSLVPLGLYQLYKVFWSKKIAFISVIFLIANFDFYASITTVSRQMIAELFYVLLFLAILKDSGNGKKSNWIILLIFLMFGLTVSHYSMSYMFLILLLSTIIFGKLFLKNKTMKVKSTFFAFSFSLTFIWYMNLVSGPFTNLARAFRTIIETFITELFSVGSRGELVQAALGVVESPDLLHNLSRYLFNITSLLILVGFVWLLLNWKKEKLNSEYVFLVCVNMGILLSTIIVPNFAGFLEIGRWYHITLLFLSPLFVLGAETVFSNILNLGKRVKRHSITDKTRKTSYCFVLSSIVLVAFFLFQSGFIYEISGDPLPSSIALSKKKMENFTEFIYESEVFSAIWLSNYGEVKQLLTFCDTTSLTRVLTGYGNIDRTMLMIIANDTIGHYAPELIHEPKIESDISYIYLRQFNVKQGLISYDRRAGIFYNVSEVPIFNEADVLVNKIYSNSFSEVYYRSP